MIVYDDKPRVMMESIKNVVVSDLVPSFLLLNLSSLSISVSMSQNSLAREHGQCEAIRSVQEIFNFRVHDIHTISPTTRWGTFRFVQEFLCTRHTYHALPTILGLAQARPIKCTMHCL